MLVAHDTLAKQNSLSTFYYPSTLRLRMVLLDRVDLQPHSLLNAAERFVTRQPRGRNLMR
jgi:hypothetical protein